MLGEVKQQPGEGLQRGHGAARLCSTGVQLQRALERAQLGLQGRHRGLDVGGHELQAGEVGEQGGGG